MCYYYRKHLWHVSASDPIILAWYSLFPTSNLRPIYQVCMNRSGPFRHNNQELTNHQYSRLYLVMRRTLLMSLLPGFLKLKDLGGLLSVHYTILNCLSSVWPLVFQAIRGQCWRKFLSRNNLGGSKRTRKLQRKSNKIKSPVRCENQKVLVLTMWQHISQV